MRTTRGEERGHAPASSSQVVHVLSVGAQTTIVKNREGVPVHFLMVRALSYDVRLRIARQDPQSVLNLVTWRAGWEAQLSSGEVRW